MNKLKTQVNQKQSVMVRIVTPGTAQLNSVLTDTQSNYLAQYAATNLSVFGYING